MKLKALLLITALSAPLPAHAGPVGAFFGGFLNALGAGTFLGNAAFVGAWSAGFGAATWLSSSVIGSLLLNIGVSFLLRPSAPGIDALRVNSRREDAPRWQLAGTVCAGGETGIFGEHDAEGNFWFIAAHGDAELVGDPAYMLDGIEVTVSDGTDGFLAGEVLTDDFCLRSNKKRYEGSGTRVPYVRLWTVAPDAANVYGALPAEFLAAFPELPADFRLAGVCFTVVRCKAIGRKNRNNIWHWSGGFRLGEPTINLIGDFNRMYDPRDAGQDVDDPDTWGSGASNPALIWAWWRVTPRGRNRPVTEINWDLVATAADACDELVADRTATLIPRYRCGVAFPDNRPRHECEAEILKSMAAFVAYDDEGKAYPVPGVYEAADLTFYGSRDVLDYQTQIIDDGEAAVHGVIVEYISPEHGWTKQPCAPWVNPLYYDGTSEPIYQTISILGCQNHNQAVRLAKDYGLTIGAAKKAALNVGLKGELAKTRRSIILDLDSDFTGEFKIATPVENSADGQSYGFAIVPMSSMQYDLEPGEEGVPPQVTPSLDIDDDLEAAVDVVVSAVRVATSSGDAVRIEATFDAPVREDREFSFRFSLQGSGVYEDMTVDMDELRAWSPIVEAGATYEVQWQTTTAGGRASDWSTAVEVVASVTPISYTLLAEPAPNGVSRSVSGLPDGTQLVLGDGEWWRRVSNDRIASAARYIAAFDTEDYQLDQAEKSLGQVISLTRSSAGTYVDAAGVIQTAAADVARIDHLAGAGALLIEPATTNLLLRSQEFDNAAWTKTRATITANAVAAPDGTMTGDKIICDVSAAATHPCSQTFAVTSGLTYTASVFLAAAEFDRIRLQFAASGFGVAQNANFDAGDETATVIGGTPTVAITGPYDGGWYRAEMTATATANATATLNIYPLDNAGAISFAGDGTSGVYVWAAQGEAQDAATSYVATAGATASRAADVVTMAGITATLDLAIQYGDGALEDQAGQSVSPSYWPTLAQTRVRQIVGRTP